MGASTIKPSALYAWEAEGFLCLQWLLITNHALLHYFLSIDNIDALRQVFCFSVELHAANHVDTLLGSGFSRTFLLQMSTIWSWKQETISQQKWAIISPPAPPFAHLHFANAWKRTMCLICIYSTIYIALSAHKNPKISLKNRLIQQLIRLKIGSKNLKNSSSIDNILCFHPKNYTQKTTKKRKKRRFHRRFRDRTSLKPPRCNALRTSAKLSPMIRKILL